MEERSMLKLDAILAEKGLRPGDAYKDYFVFYRSFANTLRNLPDKYKIALLDALMDFGLDMREPDFSEDAILAALWAGMGATLEANWINTLNGKKGGKFGVKGGAPMGNKNASRDKTTPKQPRNNPGTTPLSFIEGKEEGKEKEEDKVKGKGEKEKPTTAPALADVVLYFKKIGLTETEATRFYSEFDSVGWIDKHGRRIVKWQALADKWATHKNDYPRRTAASRAEIPEGNHEADNSLFAKNDL